MYQSALGFRKTQPNPDPTRTGLGFGSDSSTQHWVRVGMRNPVLGPGPQLRLQIV